MNNIVRSVVRRTQSPLRSASVVLVSLIAIGSPLMATTTATPIKPQVSYGASAHRETVDERITAMHAALHITSSEETAWGNVASVMRHNDAAMRKLAADRRAQSPARLSAVDDLKTYAAFNQAHLDGLKDLISSFEVLYVAMPDAQKVNADEVMARFGHAPATFHARRHVSHAT